jgi:3'(2'), 5'-bisphosphate nucleotidase
VTVADFGSQALICAHVSGHFPDEVIVGEEVAEPLRIHGNRDLKEDVIRQVRTIDENLSPAHILDSIDRGAGSPEGQGRYWTVDPIDGTKGFIRGDQYAVALALLEQNEVVVAVLGCPNLPFGSLESLNHMGCVFVAVKGEGAVMRGLGDPREREIRVSDVTDPHLALLCESFETTRVSHGDSARISEYLGIKRPHIRMDSQCKYGVVARGGASLYLRITPDESYLEKMWDHAPGALIVQEAGGKVTDLMGRPLDFSHGRTLIKNDGIIASNGRFHGKVVDAVRTVLHSGKAGNQD